MTTKKTTDSSMTALEALASQIGGKIEDGELCYGPPDSQIFISTEDGKEFFLASKHQLYSLKYGKPRRARRGTKGEDAGWYYITIAADQLQAALDLALSHSDPEEKAVEFAYESVLRDYCAVHLTEFEAGLRLFQKDGKRGVEYPAGSGYIDILAIDAKGGFVVFELKLSRGHRAVVGQVLEYIGWVRDCLAKPKQRVRGVIVARTISDELRRAVSPVPGW